MERIRKLEKEALRELRVWWDGLAKRDRGTRAELRRCSTLLEVMQVPGFHALRHRLIEQGLPKRDADDPRLALIVGVISHLKQVGDNGPPEAMSSETRDDKAPVSPLRFRQLLEARDDDELFQRVRRVLPLARGISLEKLCEDLFGWNDSIRKGWVYRYRWPQSSNNKSN